ncbi:alpha/beta hydrolase [Verrucomicrobiaceae bacterium 227]
MLRLSIVGKVMSLVGVCVCLPVYGEPGEQILLWKGTAPGEKGDIPKEQVVKKADGIERTSNVSAPSIQVFPAAAEVRNGAAVLVCPGGGYSILASEHEGSDVCRWLNKNGVTAVLLKYRVPRREGLAKHHAPLQDAQRAMGMIRSRAEEWGIDPKRVGVLGFSAGGHLAAMTLVNPKPAFPLEAAVDHENTRPDFGILIYPAYLLDEKDPDELAPELSFDKDSKPVFLAVASDDHWASSSARLFVELQRLKVPVEMHAFAKGGHGFGITKKVGEPAGTWPELTATWMKTMKLDQAK